MPPSSGEPHGHAVLVGELCASFDEVRVLGTIAQELACAGTNSHFFFACFLFQFLRGESFLFFLSTAICNMES